VNTEPDTDWLELLNTAKKIRRSVRPVTPSPGFRRHLRSDLESSLGGRRSGASIFASGDSVLSPGLVLGVCLGLAAIALALISLRGARSARRPQT
jgi:hypothetical protein